MLTDMGCWRRAHDVMLHEYVRQYRRETLTIYMFSLFINSFIDHQLPSRTYETIGYPVGIVEIELTPDIGFRPLCAATDGVETGWTKIEAAMICRQLGYLGVFETVTVPAGPSLPVPPSHRPPVRLTCPEGTDASDPLRYLATIHS